MPNDRTEVYISKGKLLAKLNEMGLHADESCLPGISAVTEMVYGMGNNTNADRIRQMNDYELAKFFTRLAIDNGCIDPPPGEIKCDGLSCFDCWIVWLKEKTNDEC